jgi:hypothetical protein
MEIKFNQVIGKEDIYQYNLFYFQRKSKTIYLNYFIGAFSIGMAIYSFVIKEYTTSIIGVLIAAYSLVLNRFITRWQIRGAINRNPDLANPITVEIGFDDEGIMYHVADDPEPKKLSWENVREVYDFKNYWYIYYSATKALFIRKSDCPDQNSVEEMLKEKFQKRYKKK